MYKKIASKAFGMIVVLFIFIITLSVADCAFAQSRTVSILIVRHAESAPGGLTEIGKERAKLLFETLRGVKFTHIFSSHTLRSFQMVQSIALKENLPIVQLPLPGSVLDGEVVTDQTTRRAPIEPISQELLKLSAGSVALVALNSENIFAILNKLGVPVVDGCVTGNMCVPCTSNACFKPDVFDNIWHIVIEPDNNIPLAFIDIRYSVGWKP